jgi:hypothetical protein
MEREPPTWQRADRVIERGAWAALLTSVLNQRTGSGTLCGMGKMRRDNSTGHVGVYRDDRWWLARIVRNGRVLFQRNFATLEAAVAARTARIAELNLDDAAPEPEPASVPGACWIRLSKGRFALIDEADFDRASRFNWFFSKGYAMTHNPDGPNGSLLGLHRFLVAPPDDVEVDHIDRNPLDCRRVNLRVASHQENMRNRRKHKNNTSGYAGVTLTRTGKWAAQASIGYKHVHLGVHATPEEAARVRDAWIRSNHGSFASLNFPEDSPRSPGEPG